jgi:ABC-type phosphate transport system substrate-binding protein
MRSRSLLVGVLAAAALAGPAGAGDLVVIVNASRDARLTEAEVAQIYLRQRRFWEDGEAIVPVNRDSGSDAREAFGRRIFGGNTRRLEIYWNRQYFQGVLPPATLASDEAVKRFVAGERRAIGYIAADLVDATVRAVLRLEGR